MHGEPFSSREGVDLADELSALFEAADDALVVLDEAGRVLRISHSLLRQLGPSVVGGPFVECVASGSRSDVGAALAELTRGGSERVRLRVAFSTGGSQAGAGGSGTWFDLRLTRGRMHGAPALFGIAREVPVARTSAPGHASLFDAAPLQFGDIFHNSLFSMSLCDAAGYFVEVNPAFERATGISGSEAVGKTAFQLGLMPALDVDLVQRRIAAEGSSHASTVTIRRRDGETRVHAFCASMVEVSGRELVLSVSFDITDYEAAQLSYRQRDQKFRALCKSLPDGVFFLGPDGRFSEVNEAACRQHGYGPDELNGVPIEDIAARPDFDFQQVIAKLREHGGQLQYETANRRKDGSVFPIQLSLALIDERDGWLVAGVARDLTDARRFESEMRETRDRFSALFATAPDALFIYEPDGTILDCNRAAEELFGRPRTELLGSSVDALGIVAEQGSVRIEPTHGPAHVGEAWRVTGPEPYRFSREGGASVDIEARSVPLAVGGKTMMLATLQDVSRRLSAERARHRLELQLHQANKMEAVGRLAGGIAHDFNNLLTVMAGYAELLLRDQPEGTALGQGLNEILLAATRASSLTTQLLAFSRKQIIEPRVLDLNVQLESAARMLERLIGEDVSLRFLPGSALYRVKVDPNQIEQLLINLAVNARDAMPTGGVLTIQTENVVLREQDLLDQPDARPGQYVRLSVEDDGMGMSPETLGRLFEPFFTTKERGRGTGLGLSIIYGVVTQNGGFISVRSELGRGSRFEIHLPRAQEAAQEVTLHKELLPIPAGHGLVLLVEDEEAVRDVTARFLRNSGYEVITAPSGDEALRSIRGDRLMQIDLLVTDVVLPGLNGRQLYEQLRAQKRDLCVVFISGYTDEIIAHHGVLESNIVFLEKPFTQDALARKVHEALARARTEPAGV